MNNDVVHLSVKAVLDGSVRYRIPMYQRNYAWREGEITQLIQDVIDYLPGGKPYYIGTLVVYERFEGQTIYETIDGQQRLTTLSLLVSFLKNENKGDFSWYKSLGIEFECREHSQKTFAAIFKKRFQDDPSEQLRHTEINTAILNGYQIIKKILPLLLKESDLSFEDFSSYLLDKVQIMRVQVPQDTDLNHYFEIMNNRGEQLEKHEVLKSRILEELNGIDDENMRRQSHNCFHLIWEACANMEKYIQAGFTPSQRHAIFGPKDWSGFEASDFNTLREALYPVHDCDKSDSIAVTLDKIIGTVGKSAGTEIPIDDTPERFNSVINFSNFLLHVLKVYTEKDIPLDDKRLISTFEDHLLQKSDSVDRVKEFAFTLLRCKYLFDHYILKREFSKGKDGWSLKRFKWGDGGLRQAERGYYVNAFGDEDGADGNNRRILMLLAVFHVSTPTLVYKHWLNAALYWLYNQKPEFNPQEYLTYLESVSKAFVFDRFLAAESIEYYDIIYKNKGECQVTRDTVSEVTLEKRLTYGNIKNNLVFNFLDYLLWVERKNTDSTINSYEFTFRSSVEHYYPQHPLKGHASMPVKELNSFGNLCLISHSKNSRLSNFMPHTKKEYYKNNAIDSIKQYLMMDDKRWPNWDESSVIIHFNEMKAVFLDNL